MEEWLTVNLVCPRNKKKLKLEGNFLISTDGYKYPVIDGIPVMLLDDVEPTHGTCVASLKFNNDKNDLKSKTSFSSNENDIDPYVQEWVAATCGIMYSHLVNNLTNYPIPDLILEESKGELFLDIGCGWGRWSFSAARKGYYVIGIDPSINAIRAASRVAKQLNIPGVFLVADARYLPFRSNLFDVVYSYSVLQHFHKNNVKLALTDISRVIKSGGFSLIQMPNKYGTRNLYNQIKKGFKRKDIFDVSYWSTKELINVFEEKIGTTSIQIDGFFGLGVQKSDIELFPLKYKAIVYLSEFLKNLNPRISFLKYFADSLYVVSKNNS